MTLKRLALFVSGSGTNMENILRQIKEGKIQAEAALVVSDRPEAAALKRARPFGVECVVIERKKFASKEDFEAEICRHLERKKIDYLLLAGFMKILSPSFVKAYAGRILNLHPALLPNFPGAHAIRDAWEKKVPVTGATVHFVDEGVDTGPVILQHEVRLDPSDTLETLEKKIHTVEYELYPKAIRLVLEGKIKSKHLEERKR